MPPRKSKTTYNIVKNLNYTGVDLYNFNNSGAATGGNEVKFNKFQNLEPASFGIGVLIYNNAYTAITDNVMNRVRVGIQTGNFEKPNPGPGPAEISNNQLQTIRIGIFHNLAYTGASNYTLSGNTITTFPGATNHEGMRIWSLQTNVGTTVSNNTVTGARLGYHVWNTPTTGTVLIQNSSSTNATETGFLITDTNAANGDGAAQATLTGVTSTGSPYGIRLLDNSSNAALTVKATVNGNSNVSGGTTAGISVEGTDATATIASNAASITGNAIGVDVNGGTASLTQNNISTNTLGVKVSNGGILTAVSNNFIKDNPDGGIRIESTAGTVSAISTNDLSGNGANVSSGKALNNLASPSITADCNYYGVATGPFSPLYVSGNVSVTSYLAAGTDSDGSTPGFQTAAGSCIFPVRNLTQSLDYQTITAAVAAANANDVIDVRAGTFIERVVIDKPLTLQGAGGTSTVIQSNTAPGAGVTGTLFKVTAANVTIQRFYFDVDLGLDHSAIHTSGNDLTNLHIFNNTIVAKGTAAGAYGRRNAIAINANVSGVTGYSLDSDGFAGVVVQGNTVMGSGGTYFRAALQMDLSGGLIGGDTPAEGNAFQSINHDVNVRFSNQGDVTIKNNVSTGGGIQAAEFNAGLGTLTIANNSLNGSLFQPASGALGTGALMRLQNNATSKPVVVTGNTFSNHRWGASIENFNTLTFSGNTFTPKSGSTDFRHVSINTKLLASTSASITPVTVGATLTGNTFNGSGTPGGTAIAFFNHRNDVPIGTYTLGTVGSENTFNAGIATFLRLDNSTGPSSGFSSPFGDYTVSGAPSTTMGPWAPDLAAYNNKFDVGTGPKLPQAMTSAERTTLEGALFHKPDDATVGRIFYFYPVTNLTQTTQFATIAPAIAAANAGDVIELAEFSFNERVVIDKSLTLQGVARSTTLIDGTGLSGTGSGITINNGVTNVTIKKLTVKNFAGSDPNSQAGIYAALSNNNLLVDDVSMLNNVGGAGFYANGPVDNVTVKNSEASGHTGGFARGMVIWNGYKTNITFTGNTVTNNSCCGIQLQDGTASGVTITGNTVSGNGDTGIGTVGLKGGAGANVIATNTVTNNGRFGILLNNPTANGATSGDGSTVVDNNQVTLNTPPATAPNSTRDWAGIVVHRRSYLGDGSNGVDFPKGIVVQNNTVTGIVQPSSAESFGIVIEGVLNKVLNNTVSGWEVGIQEQVTTVGQRGNPGDANQDGPENDTYFSRGNATVLCSNTYTGNSGSNGTNFRTVGTPTGPAPTITGSGIVCLSGTITLTGAPTGGIWSSDNTPVASVNASTGEVSGAALGSAVITYTVTDVNGCVGSATKTVTVTAPPVIGFTAQGNGSAVSASSSTPSAQISVDVCQEGSLTLSGFTPNPNTQVFLREQITLSGDPITYSGSGVSPVDRIITPANTVGYFGATYGPYGLSSGTQGTLTQVYTPFYDLDNSGTLSAGDCVGDPITLIVTVNAPAAPTISAGGPTTFCTGGSVTLTASGCTGGTYTWSPGNQTTAAITVSASGSYSVTCTKNGCTSPASAATTVTVNPIPATPTITPGGPTTFCPGGSVTLTASACSGTYLWSPGNQTTQAITVSASGNYSVTCTELGCTSPASVATTVTVNPTPATPTITAGGPTTFCTGGSVTLTASACSGTYLWSPGNQTTQAITVSAAGSYSVTCTELGCTSPASAATTVTVNPIPATPTITAGGPTTFCAGGSVTLTASACSGTYLWSPGNQTTQAITVSASGNYSVTCTELGCTSPSSAATTVTVNPIPATPTITAGGPTTFCTGGSVTLTASACSGTYLWSPGNQTTQAITVSASGSYTVTCTENTCPSPASAATIVTVESQPTASISGTTTICNGQSATLTFSGTPNAMVNYTANGNPQSVTLNGSGTASVSTGAVLVTTTYALVSVSLGTCSQSVSGSAVVTVTSSAFSGAPVLASNQTICANQSITFSFAVGTCPFPSGNVFTAQLSDASGNFGGSPTSLGTVTPGSNTVQIPANVPTGNTYRIRVVSSLPAATSAASTVAFKVTGLSFTSTPTTSQTPVCVGQNFTVSFAVTNCPFPAGNTFTVELSDASGSFASPVSLETVSPGINNAVTMPQNTAAGTGYRVRIVSSIPAQISAASSPFQVRVPAFTIAPLVTGAPVCPGQTVRVSFAISCVFFPGNVFTAQLSDATGGFGSPVSLGTVSTSALNTLTIPLGTPLGTGYKIRIVSSNPQVISTASTPFRVKVCDNTREAAPEVRGLQVTVSPNPSPEGKLRIAISGAEGQRVGVDLYNPTGQPVRQQVIDRAGEEDVLTWDIARQPGGLYLLRVNSGKESKTIKVMH